MIFRKIRINIRTVQLAMASMAAALFPFYAVASTAQEQTAYSVSSSVQSLEAYVDTMPQSLPSSMEISPVKNKQGHWSLSLNLNESYLSGNDEYASETIHSRCVGYYDFRMSWQANPETTLAYDQALKRPKFMMGLLYADFDHLHIYKEDKPFESKIGQIYTAFIGVNLALVRKGRWTASAEILNGVGYCPNSYDENYNQDQELIGSPFSIFVGGGVNAAFRLSPRWSVALGIDFKHYSNATLDRPNRGVNTMGGTVSLSYDLEPQPLRHKELSDLPQADEPEPYPKNFYVEGVVGVAGKALFDRFEIYGEKHNPIYGSFTTMLSAMWRWHLVNASGVGLDYTYADYVYRIRDYDLMREKTGYKYSPHIMGLSLRHEWFYHHMSLNVGLGVYLKKQSGYTASLRESRIYQTVSLRYSIPYTHNRLFLGYTIKAHKFSRVDNAQIILGCRIN